jgi:hypothetical protein
MLAEMRKPEYTSIMHVTGLFPITLFSIIIMQFIYLLHIIIHLRVILSVLTGVPEDFTFLIPFITRLRIIDLKMALDYGL